MKSPLIPTDSDLWVNCNGSVFMQSLHPELESRSEAQAEGSAFHWLSAQILRSWIDTESQIKTGGEYIGSFDPDGTLITDEMSQAATDYVTDVLVYAQNYGVLQSLNIEDHVNLSSVYPGMYGYIDAWVYNEEIHEIVVWEAKYGHAVVEPFENWQCIGYLRGIVDRLGLTGLHEQHTQFRIRIAQSRSFHNDGPIREWVGTVSDLRSYFNIYSAAAHDALSDSPKCKTGEHCKKCTASRGCETLQRHSYHIMDFISECASVGMSGESLGTELLFLERSQKILESRIAGLSAQCTDELKNGKFVPGYILENGKGRKRWRKDTPVNEIIMMGELLGVDVKKPVELVTPAQSEKLGIDKEVINLYSEVPSTGLKLKHDDGKKARSVFKK